MARVHEVLEGEWLTLQDEGTLCLNGLITCIGVSIYDQQTKKGYVGHFNATTFDASQRDEPNSLPNMIKQAASEINALDHTQLWVGGGLILTGEAQDYGHVQETLDILNTQTRDFRYKTIDTLWQFILQGESTSIRWLEGDFVSVNYSLNVANGLESEFVYDN